MYVLLNEIFIFLTISFLLDKSGNRIIIKNFKDQHLNLGFICTERFESICKIRAIYLHKALIPFTDLSPMLMMQGLRIILILTVDVHFNQVGMGFIQVS
ncbi:hypothetical protein [Planktothrix sp. FACHB-1365]|uniref:hypothetical protein n=1 Tax=Planktothrix sp. FACHB-1365 TaxID=2692855 RepID=UPI0016880FEE|nr:hypothetical protein [Planktothrix sp. FACHB-1365]MBD2480566.1 hypothetical protein [Planktothrix sp. FACHB-1365]